MAELEDLTIRKLRAETELAERDLAKSKNGMCKGGCRRILGIDVERHSGTGRFGNWPYQYLSLSRPVQCCTSCGDAELSRLFHEGVYHSLRNARKTQPFTQTAPRLRR